MSILYLLTKKSVSNIISVPLMTAQGSVSQLSTRTSNEWAYCLSLLIVVDEIVIQTHFRKNFL